MHTNNVFTMLFQCSQSKLLIYKTGLFLLVYIAYTLNREVNASQTNFLKNILHDVQAHYFIVSDKSAIDQGLCTYKVCNTTNYHNSVDI